jgi:hypothetical protein
MATNQKISQLNVLTGSNLDSVVDWLPVVDTSDVETKKIAPKELIDGYVNSNPLLVGNTLSLKNSSASTVQAAALIQSSVVDNGLILSTNNNGPLMRNAPDNTNFGGNSRGLFSVDLQKTRNNADEVASGNYSVVGGGVSNKASGVYSYVGGGQQNRALQNHAVTTGGLNNNNNSDRGFIGGGEGNATSTNTHASVIGGSSNTASGQRSIAGGNSNTASGTNSLCMGGSGGNIASNNRSIVIGGEGNTANAGISCVLNSMYATASGSQSMVLNSTSGSSATGSNSMVINKGNASGIQSIAFNEGKSDETLSISFNTNSRATLHNQFAISNGVNINGGSQASQLVSSKNDTLTTGGTTVLSLDGTGVTNLIIPNISYSLATNRAWNVSVDWVAVVTGITGTATGITVGDIITGESLFGFKRIGGTSSVRNFIRDASASDSLIMDTCSMTYTAGASQQLAMTFTGPTFAGGGSVTMRIVAKVSLVEVAY